MKKLCAGMLFLLVAASVQAKVPKLILGEKDGLPMECEVCGYDVEKGLVKLRAGTKSGSKPFGSFSTNVQDRIVIWATDEAFDSTSDLKVTIREKEDRDKVDTTVNNYRYSGKKEKVSYTIVLENRTPFAMENVRLEVRIFYEGRADRDSGRSFNRMGDTANNLTENQNVVYDKKYIDIPANDVVEVETPGVVILNVTGEQESNNSRFANTSMETYEEDLEGMQLILSRKGSGGHVLVRTQDDGSVPKESKWGEYDEGAPERKPAL